MTIIIPTDKKMWGPLAWHLIHNFSIKSTNNECMFILIKTFGYILPCPTCKKHYNYLISDIYELKKKNKNIMIKYLYEIHNIINQNLNKNHNLTYNEVLDKQKKTNNEKIIFFFVISYSNLNYIDMSFTEFDKIYNFFYCFIKNYPDKKIRNIFENILNNNSLDICQTPLSFKKWFINDFKEIKEIKENYNSYKIKILEKINNKINNKNFRKNK